MRDSMITLVIATLIISCRKQSTPPGNNGIEPDIQQLIQDKTWVFLSETRTGSFNERYKPEFTTTIVFSSDGKAYPRLEGQWGLNYNYNLDLGKKKMNYKFIFYLPGYMNSNVQEANIKSISPGLLVLENTFTNTDINGQILSVNLVDSLVR